MSSSDSDSDLSDIPLDSLFPKRRKYEQEEKEEQGNYYDQQKPVKEIGSEDEDEEDDYNIIKNGNGTRDRIQNGKRILSASQESEKLKIVFQDDSDESENELESENKIDSKKPVQKQVKDIKILDDSDDSDNDISHSAIKVMNNAFLDQARKARIELDMMPHINLLSDEEVDDDTIIHDNNNRTQHEINPNQSRDQDPTNRMAQKYVQVITQVKGGDASLQKIYQLKLHDPFSKLVATYKKERGYSSFRKISCELRIQNNTENMELDLNKSPHDMGIHDQCLLIVHDEEQRIKQLRNNPNCNLVGTSCANSKGDDAGAASNTFSNSHHFGNGILTIRVRINGDDKSIQHYKMNPTDSFQKLIHLVCNHNGGVDSQECKFTFEGMALNPNSTPEDEDLEGDEMIDVSIDKTVLAKIETDKCEQSSSLDSNSNCVSTADPVQTNQKTEGRKIVEVFIIRNHVSR